MTIYLSLNPCTTHFPWPFQKKLGNYDRPWIKFTCLSQIFAWVAAVASTLIPQKCIMAVFNGIFSLVLVLRFPIYSRIIMDRSKFYGKVNLLSHNVKIEEKWFGQVYCKANNNNKSMPITWVTNVDIQLVPLPCVSEMNQGHGQHHKF